MDCAGIPPANQALLFAGQVLGPDSALLLDELHLDSFSLSNEVRLSWCIAAASLITPPMLPPTHRATLRDNHDTRCKKSLCWDHRQ